MGTERVILHVDMDAFFASVEQRDNPELRGKPVLVGGSGQRGVVAAASYEAREFGVFSAMPVRQALARCPDAITVRPRMSHYQSVSREIFSVFRSITPEVEGLSVDEAFLDVSHSLKLLGSPLDIARKIKSDILSRTQLTASVGIASNKLVAKVASDLDKPDGLTLIKPGTEADELASLSVRVLPGIGKRKFAELQSFDITTIAQLQNASGETQRLLADAQSLAFDVATIEQAFAQDYGAAAAQGDFDAMIAGARERWDTSVAGFEDSLRVQAGVVSNIDGARSQMDALIRESQGAVGALQVAQAGNQLLALQSTQIADLTAAIAAQNRAEALEAARIASAAAQGRENLARFLDYGGGYSPGAVRFFGE